MVVLLLLIIIKKSKALLTDGDLRRAIKKLDMSDKVNKNNEQKTNHS